MKDTGKNTGCGVIDKRPLSAARSGGGKVIINIITLWSFLFNIIGGDLALLRPLGFVGQAWAARTPIEPTRVGANRSGGSGVLKKLKRGTLAMRQYLRH